MAQDRSQIEVKRHSRSISWQREALAWRRQIFQPFFTDLIMHYNAYMTSALVRSSPVLCVATWNRQLS